MLLDISKVLSEQQATIDKTIELDITECKLPFGTYPIVHKDLVHIEVSHIKEREYKVFFNARITLEIPCDRCLTGVNQEFIINTAKYVDLSKQEGEHTEDTDEFDESNFIHGYKLDVDQLLCSELIIEWNIKILCNENCKGLCNVCGVDQNNSSCKCESTNVDIQMSRVRDMFNDFKEV